MFKHPVFNVLVIRRQQTKMAFIVGLVKWKNMVKGKKNKRKTVICCQSNAVVGKNWKIWWRKLALIVSAW